MNSSKNKLNSKKKVGKNNIFQIDTSFAFLIFRWVCSTKWDENKWISINFVEDRSSSILNSDADLNQEGGDKTPSFYTRDPHVS